MVQFNLSIGFHVRIVLLISTLVAISIQCELDESRTFPDLYPKPTLLNTCRSTFYMESVEKEMDVLSKTYWQSDPLGYVLDFYDESDQVQLTLKIENLQLGKYDYKPKETPPLQQCDLGLGNVWSSDQTESDAHIIIDLATFSEKDHSFWMWGKFEGYIKAESKTNQKIYGSFVCSSDTSL